MSTDDELREWVERLKGALHLAIAAIERLQRERDELPADVAAAAGELLVMMQRERDDAVARAVAAERERYEAQRLLAAERERLDSVLTDPLFREPIPEAAVEPLLEYRAALASKNDEAVYLWGRCLLAALAEPVEPKST